MTRISHYTKPMISRALGVSLSAVTARIAVGRMKTERVNGVTLVPAAEVRRWDRERQRAARDRSARSGGEVQ